MWSKAALPVVFLTSLQVCSVTAQKLGVPKPSVIPIPDQVTSQGCFSSGGNLTLAKDVEYVSSGSCGDKCKTTGKYVMALHGAQCYCGMEYPPKDTVAKLEKCSYPCPGFDQEACGGIGDPGYWSVFNTGNEVDVPNSAPEDDEDEDEDDDDSDSDSGSGGSTGGSSSVASSAAETGPATTIIETSPATETSDSGSEDGKKDGGPNTAGIAAGVVVGVVIVGAGIGGFFFWLRRRRNAEIEEDHRRNAAVNAFINGSKPPGSSGGVSMSDSRLDPVMAHRRMSDGSIADNQDYSRRILRVTNA